MADLRFDPKRMEACVGRTQALVRQGIPVRFWAVHHDGFAPNIEGNILTHYLTVIGYSFTRFLVYDPWPSGSSLEYDGGMFPKMWNNFLGELVYDPGRPELGIRSPAESRGDHKYVIIGGP